MPPRKNAGAARKTAGARAEPPPEPRRRVAANYCRAAYATAFVVAALLAAYDPWPARWAKAPLVQHRADEDESRRRRRGYSRGRVAAAPRLRGYSTETRRTRR